MPMKEDDESHVWHQSSSSILPVHRCLFKNQLWTDFYLLALGQADLFRAVYALTENFCIEASSIRPLQIDGSVVGFVIAPHDA